MVKDRFDRLLKEVQAIAAEECACITRGTSPYGSWWSQSAIRIRLW
ncbi:MAG: hypothetical protein ACLUUO_15430 [Sellimonas intestinalis]